MKLMKKLSPILALVLVAALITACGSAAPGYDKKDLMLSEYNEATASVDVLIHNDAEGNITGQHDITLRYENRTDRDYTYTALQRLEVQLDGDWYIVPDAQDFVTMQIFTVPAGSSVEQDFRFEERYETLLPGTYRILKSFGDYEGNQEISWLEFTIK